MPYKPQFGGTNGVPELDLGQEGSARETAGDAAYNPNVVVGGVPSREVQNEAPQQGMVFVDVLGPGPQPVTWSGFLRVKNDAVLAAIESDLLGAKIGQTVTDGVRGPLNAALIKETRLTNKAGRVLSEKARLKEYKFERQKTITTPGSTLTIGLALLIRFEILG